MASFLILLPVCLIVCAGVLLNTTANLFQRNNPELALSLNPLLVEARLQTVMNNVEAGLRSDLGRGEIESMANRGAGISPADARLYSLAGIVEEELGNREKAETLYDEALRRMPTELQALQRKFRILVERDELVEAANLLEIFGRRWRKHWAGVQSALLYLVNDDDARERIAERFSAEAYLRRLLIESLAQSPSGLRHAYAILLEWHGRGVPGLHQLINGVTMETLRTGNDLGAFMMFRLTRDADSPASGFVYNGDFSHDPSGNLFDWQFTQQAGVDISIADRLRKQASGDEETVRSLSVRFLNNPVRFDNVQQVIRLPAGSYEMEIAYATRSLRTPKPIRVGLNCLRGNRQLVNTEMESGTTDETLTVAFTVPSACGLQRFHLFNGNLIKSWKSRYSGTLFLDYVTITQAGS